MYAVIESGGKQYRVRLGAEIQVDHLEAVAGDSITFDRVLLVADDDGAAVGQPHVTGAAVSADVVSQDRGDKIVVFKYRPKARRRVKKGFRAALTTLRISDITYDGQSAATLAAQQAEERERAEQAALKAAAERAAADKALATRLAAEMGTPATQEGGPAEAVSTGAQGRLAGGNADARAETDADTPSTDAQPADTSEATVSREPAARTGSPDEDASTAAAETVSTGAPDERAVGASPSDKEGDPEASSPATGKDI